MAYSWFTYNDSTSDPSHAPPPPADPHGFSDDQFEDLMGSKDIFFLQSSNEYHQEELMDVNQCHDHRDDNDANDPLMIEETDGVIVKSIMCELMGDLMQDIDPTQEEKEEVDEDHHHSHLNLEQIDSTNYIVNDDRGFIISNHEYMMNPINPITAPEPEDLGTDDPKHNRSFIISNHEYMMNPINPITVPEDLATDDPKHDLVSVTGSQACNYVNVINIPRVNRLGIGSPSSMLPISPSSSGRGRVQDQEPSSVNSNSYPLINIASASPSTRLLQMLAGHIDIDMHHPINPDPHDRHEPRSKVCTDNLIFSNMGTHVSTSFTNCPCTFPIMINDNNNNYHQSLLSPIQNVVSTNDYNRISSAMQRSQSSHVLGQFGRMGNYSNIVDDAIQAPKSHGVGFANVKETPLQDIDESVFVSSMRRVVSTGDLQAYEEPKLVSYFDDELSPSAMLEGRSNQEDKLLGMKIGHYNSEERKLRLHRYRQKRSERNFNKKIKYACRKTLADRRPRIRGRFARTIEDSEEPNFIKEMNGLCSCEGLHYESDDDPQQVVQINENHSCMPVENRLGAYTFWNSVGRTSTTHYRI